jgi:hypothetical protein
MLPNLEYMPKSEDKKIGNMPRSKQISNFLSLLKNPRLSLVSIHSLKHSRRFLVLFEIRSIQKPLDKVLSLVCTYIFSNIQASTP